MPDDALDNNKLNTLKWISDILGLVTAFSPLPLNLTLGLSPPLFYFLDSKGWIPILISIIIFTVIYFGYPTPKREDVNFSPIGKRIFWLLGFLIIAIVTYAILFNLTTVDNPRTKKVEFQIGFGNTGWGLTDFGRKIKEEHPNETVEQWMEDDGAFARHGPEAIWQTWTIYFAGGLLMLTYIAMFVFGTAVWALLAKLLKSKIV